MLKYILALILVTSQAFAGLPPTTSKGSADSTDVTTFKYRFPNFAVTHSGTIATLGTLGVAGGGTGTGTAFTTGSVIFAGASGTYTQDNANFFWDDTNNRLGIGNAAPTLALDVTGSMGLSGQYLPALGSNSAPTYSFTGDTNTGMYSSGADTINFATGGTSRVSIVSNGGFRFGAGAGSGFSGGGLGEFDISYGGAPASLIIGADNNTYTRTNATTKSFRIGAAPYNTSDKATGVLVGMSNGSDNQLNWGGGTSVLNAATIQVFYTAANTTTTTGTEAMRINGAQQVGIGTGSTINALFHVNGSYAGAVASLTTNTTLDNTHQFVSVSASGGAVTITLPACTSSVAGRMYAIKKTDSSSNNVTIARSSSDTIDGATSIVIDTQYRAYKVVCQSAGVWYIY